MTWEDYKDAFPAGRNIVESGAPTSDPQEPVTAGSFRYERTTLTDAAGNHPFAAWLRYDDRMPHIGPSIASDAEDALLAALAAASPDSAPAGLDLEAMAEAIRLWYVKVGRNPRTGSYDQPQAAWLIREYERLRATPASTTGPDAG